MSLNVSMVERLQITSSECHKRCHMHTAATFALDENKNGQHASGQMCPLTQEKNKVNRFTVHGSFTDGKKCATTHEYVFKLA